MISGISRISVRTAVIASVAALVPLVLLAGPVYTFAQTAATPANGNSAPPLVLKVKRQVERGPVKPPSYPTQPQQEVRKLR